MFPRAKFTGIASILSVIASTLTDLSHICSWFLAFWIKLPLTIWTKKKNFIPKQTEFAKQSNTFLTWNNAWISTLYSPQTFASFSVSRNMNQICIYSYKTHECSNIEHWHHRGEKRQYMHIRRHLKDLTKNVYHALKFPLLKYVRKQCMQ